MGSLLHEVEPRHWPAGLSDSDTVSSVFRAYGPGSHIAVVRQRSLPSHEAADVWVACDCGLTTPARRAGRDDITAVLGEARAFANQHIDQTRN